MKPTRVTLTVAKEYARARGLSITAATDELLRVLADAREQAPDGGPTRLRYRNRSDRIDITARVVNGCVVSVNVRPYGERKTQEDKQ